MNHPMNFLPNSSVTGANNPNNFPPVSSGSGPTSSVGDNFDWSSVGPFQNMNITGQSLAESSSQQLATGPRPQLTRLVTLASEDKDTWHFKFAPMSLEPSEVIIQVVNPGHFTLDSTAEDVAPRLVSYQVSSKAYHLMKFNLGAKLRKDYIMRPENIPAELEMASSILAAASIVRAKQVVLGGIARSRQHLWEWYRVHGNEFQDLRAIFEDECYWTFRLVKDDHAIYKAIDNALMIFKHSQTKVKPTMIVMNEGCASYIALYNEYETLASSVGETKTLRNLNDGSASVLKNIKGFDVYENVNPSAINISKEESYNFFTTPLYLADFHLLDRSEIPLDLAQYETDRILSFQYISMDSDWWETRTMCESIEGSNKFNPDSGDLTTEIDGMLQSLHIISQATGFNIESLGGCVDPHVYKVNVDFPMTDHIRSNVGGFAKIEMWGDQNTSYWSNAQLYAHSFYAEKKIKETLDCQDDLTALFAMQKQLHELFSYNNISDDFLTAWVGAIALNYENASETGNILRGNSFGFVQPPYITDRMNIYIKDINGLNQFMYLRPTAAGGLPVSIVQIPGGVNPAHNELLIFAPNRKVLPGFGSINGAMTLAHMHDTGDYRGWDIEVLKTLSKGVKALASLEEIVSDAYCKPGIVNMAINDKFIPHFQQSDSMDDKTRRMIALWNIGFDGLHEPAFIRRPEGNEILLQRNGGGVILVEHNTENSFRRLLSMWKTRDPNIANFDHVNEPSWNRTIAGELNQITKANSVEIQLRVLKAIFQHRYATMAPKVADVLLKADATTSDFMSHYMDDQRNYGELMDRSFHAVMQGQQANDRERERLKSFGYIWKKYIIEPEARFTVNFDMKADWIDPYASLFWFLMRSSYEIYMGGQVKLPDQLIERNILLFKNYMKTAQYKENPVILQAERIDTGQVIGNLSNGSRSWINSRLVFQPDLWNRLARELVAPFPNDRFKRAYLKPYRPFNPLSSSQPLFADIIVNTGQQFQQNEAYLNDNIAAFATHKVFKTVKTGLPEFHKKLRCLMSVGCEQPNDANTMEYYGSDQTSFLQTNVDPVYMDYNAEVMNLLPGLRHTFVYSSHGESKEVLTDRSPFMIDRLRYIDSDIKSSLQKICAILYCFTKATKQSLLNWANKKLPIPWCCTLQIRPWMRFKGSGILFAKPGAETAVTGYNYSDATMEVNSTKRQYEVHITKWFGLYLKRHDNFFVRPNFKSEGYEAGMGGTIYTDYRNFDPANPTMNADCFLFDCGSNFTLPYVMKCKYPLPIYGKMTETNVYQKVHKRETIFEIKTLPFPSFFFQCWVWGWHKIRSDNATSFESLEKWVKCKKYPELAGFGKMRVGGMRNGEKIIVIPGKNHFENFDPPFKPALTCRAFFKEGPPHDDLMY